MTIAKVVCTCQVCGRKFTAQKIFHTVKEKKEFGADWRRKAREMYTICDDCCAKEWYRNFAWEKRRRIEESRVKGYPELTGSVEKVTWATCIREDVANRLERMAKNNFLSRFSISPGSALVEFEGHVQRTKNTITNIVNAETDADFWVMNRHEQPIDIVNKYTVNTVSSISDEAKAFAKEYAHMVINTTQTVKYGDIFEKFMGVCAEDYDVSGIRKIQTKDSQTLWACESADVFKKCACELQNRVIDDYPEYEKDEKAFAHEHYAFELLLPGGKSICIRTTTNIDNVITPDTQYAVLEDSEGFLVPGGGEVAFGF